MNTDGGMTVTVESVLEPTGETIRKEFAIETITDVRNRFVLIDEDGEGRLMLTGDELHDLGTPETEAGE
jgi:hypothetical protein